MSSGGARDHSKCRKAREIRVCVAPACDTTFTVIITSKRKYCSRKCANKNSSRKGKTYEEIYGDRAKEVKAKQQATNNCPEIKAKRRVSLRIAMNRPEVTVKLSKSAKKRCTPEWRAKQSDSMIGDKNPMKRPGVRAKLSATLKVVLNCPEVKKRHRIANSLPEVKAKRSASLKITLNRPEVKAKMSVAQIGKHFSKETIEKMKNSAKENWADPEYKRKHVRAVIKGNKFLPNKPEKFLDKLFQGLFPNQIKYIGDGKDEDSIVGGRCPDFIFTDGQKKIIEHFGDYHHGEKRTGVPNEQHEQERIDHFAKYGYQTLIIWEHELEDIGTLQNKLLAFTEEPAGE